MRTIYTDRIQQAVYDLCADACCVLGNDVSSLIERAMETEENPLVRSILQKTVENARIAREERLALCQDTGMMVIFLELGQDVHIEGGDLYHAVQQGVRRSYRDHYFRKSVLDPITRENTGDNTPAVIHTEIVPGDTLTITAAPKGFGSENMSRLAMLKPSDGIEGAEDFIVDTVAQAGGNPCPPLIVGVGIGGTMELACLLAKKALLREAGAPHPDANIAAMERELLDRINALGIGPQGLGGSTTALAVHILTHPTHIAGLPVAVNIQCHVARHRSVTL